MLEKIKKFVILMRLLHDDMECCITVDGGQSDFFTVTCGVMQGCALASTLFALVAFCCHILGNLANYS